MKRLGINKSYINYIYRYKLGYKLNLVYPKTYNEKINYRKLYDKNPLLGIVSNKFLVKKYAEDKLGYSISPKTIWVGNRIETNFFDSFPKKFVLKITNASGENCIDIIRDKYSISKESLVSKYNKLVKIKYGKYSGELWYDYTKQLIMVEELLEDGDEIPIEYKVYCYNSEKGFDAIIRVIFNRHSNKTQSFYDLNWNFLNLKYMDGIQSEIVTKPSYFYDMIELSKKLSIDFDHLRLDLMYYKGLFYLGEYTFADSSGFIKFDNEKWNIYFGEKWKIKLKN
jgi:hypothetical protein